MNITSLSSLTYFLLGFGQVHLQVLHAENRSQMER